MESNNFDRKKSIIAIIFAISLILIGVILAIILAVKFVGEDGYIRDDAPGEWLFIVLIPIILGGMILFIPITKIKKEAKSYQNFDGSSEISPEQLNRMHEQNLKSLNKGKFIIVIITVIFFGLLILLVILGKLSWAELIDAIF